MRENLQRLDNVSDTQWHIVAFERRELVEEAVEVIEDLRRQLNTSHAPGQRRGWRAAGLRGRSPRALASR